MTTPTIRCSARRERPEVPLAIWPVAQTTAQWQRAGRYLPACTAHSGKMLPELARRILAEYSEPGQLIDLPGALVRVGEEAGLVLDERNGALLAGLRCETVVPRISFFAVEQVRKARAAGVPRLVTAYKGLMVWRRL